MASRPAKKRRLSPQPDSHDSPQPNAKSGAKAQKAFIKNAANWDLENAYEAKAKKGKKRERASESTRLPTKSADGNWKQATPRSDQADALDSDEDWLEGAEEDDSQDDSDAASSKNPNKNNQPDVPAIPEAQQIREAKEELAKIATMVNEDPEENVGAFKALAKIGQSHLPTIKKITLATQLAVYKDVIPGYRIRPIAEDGPQEKLSKEVRKLRAYEQSLVSGYQGYLKDLARHAKAGRNRSDAPAKGGQSLATIAITCACTLLNAVPHFNFRSDLLKILVGKLSTRRVDDDFVKCLRALETLFQEDEDGKPTMDAVSLLSKMMKAREYKTDESVVNLFLHLRLLSEFSGKGSKDSVERSDGGKSNTTKKKEFRTKRERKQIKEQKALQKDMDQADALVSHEERDRAQSETLKLVFATYFRVLKLRRPHLMGAVLEGLAKYAHLINQDFFGDILEALKDLIRHSDAAENEDEDEGDEEEGEGGDDDAPVRNTSREALLCTVTAFALLAGQDAHNARSDLHLDLSFFTTHLYQTLYPLSLHPDLELGAKSLHLPDPTSSSSSASGTAAKPPPSANKVNLQTTTVLLIRSLTSALLPPWHARSTPPLRLASFAKQLMTASLHVPERSCQAVLALLADVARSHGRRIASLWHTEERKGDGTFRPLAHSLEAANPFAATVWEGELLRHHYCPKVREGVRLVERGIAADR